MTDKVPICMPVYNRPEYFKQTLKALGQCEGLENFQVIITAEPDFMEEQFLMQEMLPILQKTTIDVHRNVQRLGCNGNVLKSMLNGFAASTAGWAVCLEDDIVLAKDALLWLTWAIGVYGNNPSCFSVSAYQSQREDAKTKLEDLDKTIMRGALLPWGWAITRERFEDAQYWWEKRPEGRPGLWDDNLCYHMEQKMMFEVCPVISRAQNIGAIGFNANDKQDGYGSIKHWRDYQFVHDFIGDAYQNYTIPLSYQSFDPAYIDAFRRTYMRKRGIKVPPMSGTLLKIER